MSNATPSVGHAIALSAPSIRCGGCVASIEEALNAIPGIDSARDPILAHFPTLSHMRCPAPSE
ncbi:heavy-metal-associated domain-containing protein [Pseudooceanicola sp.]|uniref:heavy-metal-associated domain-containing protein n=1 Tax=Pseudooceanicola sp. TaxID=1914328 RepID=UPI0040584F0E